MVDGCVFCDISEGRAPGFIVGENELAFALLDIQPMTDGHCLVVPRRHVQWWDEMTAEETAAVFELARLTALKIRRAFNPDLIMLNTRGRRIPHAHIFLIPTKENDPVERMFDKIQDFQENTPDLAKYRDPERLQAAFEKLKNA